MKAQVNSLFLTVLFFVTVLNCKAGDKPAYVIYSKDGKVLEYTQMIKGLSNAEVVFFGELHNNPISHWLQLQITKELASIHDQKIVLGAEMFESDNQIIMNEYMAGKISADSYKNEMRLWSNYQTDYSPMVELAKSQKIPFIATNVPRRYASMVYKYGFQVLDSLSKEAKNYFAPLPIFYDSNLECYKKMIEMSGGHGGENLPKAQALKDATMAYFIHQHVKNAACFIHYNGAYHSDNYQGIVWYLNRLDERLKVKTITTVLQDDISALSEENFRKADYIVCVPSDMITTH